MLVLTRKVGDRIWIGDDICVTVVNLERGKVRIGIEAPKAVNVRRAELDKPSESPSTGIDPILVTCP